MRIQLLYLIWKFLTYLDFMLGKLTLAFVFIVTIE